MVTVVANQKGSVGKTATAANVGALFAQRGRRVLVVDTDPQFALTRQLGLEARSLGVNLVDVLAGRAGAADAIVRGVHGVDVIPAAGELAGVEMSLVGELGRERFLHDALEPVVDDYDEVVIDTPPNLGLLTVNALVCSDCVLAPVSAEDEGAVHRSRMAMSSSPGSAAGAPRRSLGQAGAGATRAIPQTVSGSQIWSSNGILELRGTITKLAKPTTGAKARFICRDFSGRWSTEGSAWTSSAAGRPRILLGANDAPRR